MLLVYKSFSLSTLLLSYQMYCSGASAFVLIAVIVNSAVSPIWTVTLVGWPMIDVLPSANAFIGKSENTITSASARLNSLFFMIFLLRCVLKLIHSNYIFFTC